MGLNTLSLEELKQLRKDIDKAIETYEARKLVEARTKLEAMAAEMGVTLEAVVGTTGKRKAKSKSIPKYRHPENPSKTWSGRGRKPAWFSDALKNGMTEDDLKI
ncbi:H-NS histone family protein [Maritalea mobilis]|uniref:H-NS histone family protein n=1 Tax=Maritalea mobilis TaxID=483324 RepID=UPI001C96B5A1|nr:H-NS histone family protein [Maritalea mobilis]MBY6202820.1 H-NS histone family protein [Maritalea mobilis]